MDPPLDHPQASGSSSPENKESNNENTSENMSDMQDLPDQNDVPNNNDNKRKDILSPDNPDDCKDVKKNDVAKSANSTDNTEIVEKENDEKSPAVLPIGQHEDDPVKEESGGQKLHPERTISFDESRNEEIPIKKSSDNEDEETDKESDVLIKKKKESQQTQQEEAVSQKRKVSPQKDAFFFSKYISFFWLTNLLVKGSKKTLEEDDLEGILPDDCTHPLTDKLEKTWNRYLYDGNGKINKDASLKSAVIKTFGLQYCLLGIIPALVEICKLLQPIFIGLLIKYFTVDSTVTTKSAVGYAFLILVLFFISSWLSVAYAHLKWIAGTRVRVAITGLIYKKVLTASPQALARCNTGYIMNLVAADGQKIERAALYLHYVFIGPIEFVIMCFFLYNELGPASLAGIAVLLLLSPMQMLMGRGLMWCRRIINKWTDERVRVMSEIISGMKVIKLYTWEGAFTDMIHKIRRNEIKAIRHLSWLRASLMSFFFSSGSLVAFITFMTYALLGNELTSQKAFTSLALFNVARQMFTMFFPVGIAFYLESLVCLDRIKKFLIEDEIDINSSGKIFRPKPEHCCINVNNISASWTEENNETLKDISFEVNPHEMVAVIGPVGSGKSSLLMTILGELEPTQGNVDVKGQIAYVSQEAWIFNGTVRYNITFGKDFNEEKYNAVLQVCGLEKDIEMFAEGDMTLVGERGVTLSGGQKTRINLARAVYSDADIYLLDDPLSAVDAHVGRHIYDKCIMGYLSSKPRILVTHQLQYLTNVDNIIALKDGVCMQGSLNELKIDFKTDIIEDDTGIDTDVDLMAKEVKRRSLNVLGSCRFERLISQISQRSLDGTLSDSVAIETADIEFEDKIEKIEESVIPKETKQEGSITFDVYKRFFQAGYGWGTWLMLLLLLTISQAVHVFADWWLSFWCNEEEKYPGVEYPDRDRELGIYGALTFCLVALGLARAFLFFKVILKSTERIHMCMFKAMMRAPLHFFDTNSIGRIVNRFSKDMSLVDDMLSFSCFELSTSLLTVLSVFILIAVNMPIVLALLVPVFVIAVWTRMYFIKTAREVRRIEGVARSPVFGHLSTTLLGISTIRSYKVQERFFDMFAEVQDKHSETFLTYIALAAWLMFNLDLLCGLVITFCCVIPIVFANQFSAGTVGLMIVYAINIQMRLQRLLLHSSELENQFTSVERILEYCDLEPEAENKTDYDLPVEWPRRGSIDFSNVNFKYHETYPNILHALTAHVKSQEKIGICGRTGAGKSSLLSTIFRTAEPDGVLTIDGVNIKEIGLKDLRSKLSIIPQEPIIFSGTMRRNIDPFSEYLDEELWNVLEEVQLKDAVNDLPDKLETIMSETGSNFSVGQRQLVCLARAILRQNRILVIDEATANVDLKTDNLIQETIRDKFKHCTVLTIAHRLQTIMDSDRIMVLDAGHLKEFDKPYKLLRCKNSIFYSLVKQTGEEAKYFDMAFSHYLKMKTENGENVSELKKGVLGDCNGNCKCKRRSRRKSSTSKRKDSKKRKSKSDSKDESPKKRSDSKEGSPKKRRSRSESKEKEKSDKEESKNVGEGSPPQVVILQP